MNQSDEATTCHAIRRRPWRERCREARAPFLVGVMTGLIVGLATALFVTDFWHALMFNAALASVALLTPPSMLMLSARLKFAKQHRE